jgi:hypothetical protein
MRAIEVLTKQINGVNSLYHEIADDLTESEWTARVFAGSNRLAFTLWHLPRTQDWAVQTVVRGVPEVIAATGWSGKGGLQTPGMGAGMTIEEADAIAATVSLPDVVAYADAVHRTVLEWLGSLEDADLDLVPDMAAHEAAFPEYQRAGFRAAVADLVGKPVWRFVLGPCNGHPRGHLGELGILKQALRTR